MKTADIARSSKGRIAELQTALGELAASQVAMTDSMCIALAVFRDYGRKRNTGIIGWLEVIESDLSTTLAETTATEKSAVAMQQQAPKMQRHKTGPSYVHSMTVDVQLCLKLGVAEVSGKSQESRRQTRYSPLMKSSRSRWCVLQASDALEMREREGSDALPAAAAAAASA